MDVEDTSDWAKTRVEKSVTEQSALDEFLTTAEMAGKEFESGNWRTFCNSIKHINYKFAYFHLSFRFKKSST